MFKYYYHLIRNVQILLSFNKKCSKLFRLSFHLFKNILQFKIFYQHFLNKYVYIFIFYRVNSTQVEKPATSPKHVSY